MWIDETWLNLLPLILDLTKHTYANPDSLSLPLCCSHDMVRCGRTPPLPNVTQPLYTVCDPDNVLSANDGIHNYFYLFCWVIRMPIKEIKCALNYAFPHMTIFFWKCSSIKNISFISETVLFTGDIDSVTWYEFSPICMHYCC